MSSALVSHGPWSPRHGSFRAALCLAAAAAVDLLFFEQPIGWTIALVWTVLLVSACWRGHSPLRTWPGRVVAAILLLLVGSMIEQPGVLAGVLATMALLTLLWLSKAPWTQRPRRWVERWVWALLLLVVRPVLDAMLGHRWRQRHPSPHGVRRLATVWLLPIIFTAAFGALFLLANPILTRWLQWSWEHMYLWLEWFPKWVSGPRLVLWFVTGWTVWALLRIHLRVRPDARPNADPQWSAADGWLTPPVVLRALLLFNVLFAVQSVLDSEILWWGAALPTGMTYAEYAHRGAYPLLATAMLAALFVLITFRQGGPAEHVPWARRLVYLWVGQNIFLTVNSFIRLWLYVDAYSLTRWRVAAALWMLLVGLGLGWIVLRLLLQRSNAWLVAANALTCLTLLLTTALLNIDGFIARYNVTHCREVTGAGAPIDLDYLRLLGEESLPALTWLGAQLSGSPLQPTVMTRQRALAQEIDATAANWRGWTWRRQRLLADYNQAHVMRPSPPATGAHGLAQTSHSN